MNIRVVLVLMLLGIVLIQESEGLFLKAKIIAAKKPLLIAKAAVAKEVGLKAKIAAKKTVAAAKATALAVKSAALAPIKVAKKTIGIKIAAVKAAKALKIAKIAKLLEAKAAAGGGASQLILPQGALAVLPLQSFHGLPLLSNSFRSNPSVFSNLGKSFQISPLFSNIRNSEDIDHITTYAGQHAYNPQIEYRFVPDSGFRHYNQIQFLPNVHLDVQPQQTISIQEPQQTYSLPSVQQTYDPELPQQTYGLPIPQQTYGLPSSQPTYEPELPQQIYGPPLPQQTYGLPSL